MLFTPPTPAQVLLEFKEYATEVDVDFVRKAVRAIGYCAVSIPAAAERWVAAEWWGRWCCVACQCCLALSVPMKPCWYTCV